MQQLDWAQLQLSTSSCLSWVSPVAVVVRDLTVAGWSNIATLALLAVDICSTRLFSLLYESKDLHFDFRETFHEGKIKDGKPRNPYSFCSLKLDKTSHKPGPGSKSEEISSIFLMEETVKLHYKRKEELLWFSVQLFTKPRNCFNY